MKKKELLTACVIAAHGRHYLATTGDGKMLHCVTRGKKSDVAVGDSINATPTAKGQAVIESINERRSLLYRSDQYKSETALQPISTSCLSSSPLNRDFQMISFPVLWLPRKRQKSRSISFSTKSI